MPEYKFLNKKTNKEYLLFMKISERDQYLKDNPDVEQLVHGFPGLSDPVKLGRKKPDQGFREVLRKIKKQNPGSNMDTF